MTMRLKLRVPESALEMTPVEPPWLLIEVAGYWVYFRFANRADLKKGETRGLRYVGRVVPKTH